MQKNPLELEEFENSERFCRICLAESQEVDSSPLISPCKCSGT